jgi:hypothetical protein
MELSILQHYIQILGKTTLFRSFELHIYEILFSSLKDLLFIKQETLTKQITKYIRYLRTGAILSPQKSELFNHLKDQSLKFERKLRLYDASLRQIMNDDETLALMYISTFQTKPVLYQ